MKLLLFCLALLLVSAHAHVHDLTAADFHSVVDGSKAAFVKFYAPWCGHCKRLAPDWENLGNAFENLHERVVIAQVDCDAEANKPLCSEFGVQGFPTLNWFARGEKEPTKYNGGRTLEELIKYVNDNAGVNARVPGKEPSAVVDLTDDTFDSIVLDKKKHVFVEFYAPWCGHCKSLAPTYEKLGRVFANDEDIVIARIDADGNKNVAGRFSVSGFPTLKYFPKDNKGGVEYNGGRELAELVSAINEKFGAKRDVEGNLDQTAGRVPALDEIVKKLSQGSSKEEVKKELNEAVSTLPSAQAKDGAIYVALTDKYTSSYVDSEVSRLQRLIKSGSVTPKKVDEFTKRINILKAFQ